ncbi:MAG: glycosyltransferase [Chitinophagaceae bacterium]|nr:glycosyltransferase [Chitinophagaceae bacterium]
MRSNISKELFEVLVVDDHSTDNTAAIVKHLQHNL